jgi:hypothetical protein
MQLNLKVSTLESCIMIKYLYFYYMPQHANCIYFYAMLCYLSGATVFFVIISQTTGFSRKKCRHENNMLTVVLRRTFIHLISTIIESHNGDDATKDLLYHLHLKHLSFHEGLNKMTNIFKYVEIDQQMH